MPCRCQSCSLYCLFPLDTEDGDLDDYEKETSLMLVKHQKIDMKNFSTEVRARKDIDRFLEKPTVLLNVHKTKIEDIIDLMLDKIIEDKQLQKIVLSFRIELVSDENIDARFLSLCLLFYSIYLLQEFLAVYTVGHIAKYRIIYDAHA
ncbi:predicted protein [Nematostella vectensis]|uniref:Uncharacterized protein n=1 Tax=Nematostella vectensis TaxID=45351 RepID=A7S4E0_NEMVE|nr:predicted protein [Nematostella vectensis]|eukprot:XP_001633565.1 predicted protein [Nematostella vectensis]